MEAESGASDKNKKNNKKMEAEKIFFFILKKCVSLAERPTDILLFR